MTKLIDVKEAVLLENKVFVDVRSPHEFNSGAIPGAINIPLLNDEERVEVGTLYKVKGSEVAKTKGLEIISPKLMNFYEEINKIDTSIKNIVIYCARGGLRSTFFTNFFSLINRTVFQLDGGFKSYRNFAVNYLTDIKQYHDFIVLHGYTGVGKTELLHLLSKQNIPILDLEGLAHNKGSVFGQLNEPIVTQKDFENQLLDQLIHTGNRYVVVESESKRLGSVNLPNELYDSIINGRHILISTSPENRVGRLVDDYVNNCPGHEDMLISAIDNLRKRISNERADSYIKWVKEKKFEKIADELMSLYYDPMYLHSIEKYNYDIQINYDKIEDAVLGIAEFYNELEGKIQK